ncbi:hypothetical protein CHLNCDRAFT_141048 [Chlorella variabilis]|uniref:FAE domain-containing protein n=1 Tax=Chlorella variabilis TaxID=554065 RepID=E1ZS17_CHLVA|nr:hypothetical protein CHLNCDRAFT_141048 [Chlorella variabilis]EFN51426.1 hypothetical protein CHLNCDRAFT_141048 [Chlorella variabilis]|eukprot:XP_005843528.1 hypothetical protein CHLNCDRAFT_141048 [Chlorella variabilis]
MARQSDFPPRWVAKALKTLFACAHYAAAAAAGYAAYVAAARLRGLHSAGQLLPPLVAAFEARHTLAGGHLAAAAAAAAALWALAALLWRRRAKQPIYLLDFECYRPEQECMVSYNKFVTGSRNAGFFDDAAMDFQTRILHKSGLSEETFFPPGLHLEPPEFDMNRARQEAEIVMFNSVADVLRKTGLTPRQIDVLAAIVLTNKRSERRRSKYELQHVVRVHMGADDAACVFQRPDHANCIGVELSKDLVSVAGRAMEINMTRLGPLVLPWPEKLMFAANWVARHVLRLRVPKYIPDFREAFDHFCLHAGGYGNTSSSTVWYSFGFVESVQGVRRGDIVWQIGFGSGFKCNSVVWRALQPIKAMHRVGGRSFKEPFL